MQRSENISLKSFNTFGIDAKARHFAEVFTEEDIRSFLDFHKTDHEPFIILGGGSNILFTGDYNGTVLKISTRGISIVEETEDRILIRSNAGENWDGFVEYCVKRKWGGLENLSLIPGNVGTSPVQNIGAYGIEIKNVLHSLEAIHIESGEKRTFTNEECKFGYRDSVFKNEPKGQFIILNVTFRLSKKPVLNTSYSALSEELAIMKIVHPTLETVRDAVIKIRRRKLPDPAVIGNAGSFFKNPVVSETDLVQLRRNFPGIVSYSHNRENKIPAAWLIEQSGWKGKRIGDAGVHINQPLVLVNYGNATGAEILDLAKMIRESVYEKFGISLEQEVNIV